MNYEFMILKIEIKGKVCFWVKVVDINGCFIVILIVWWDL